MAVDGRDESCSDKALHIQDGVRVVPQHEELNGKASAS
jgi:hypothetical protein